MDKERVEFVKKCGELLNIAKPHLVSCRLMLGKDIKENIGERYVPEEEYVKLSCENGYYYVIPVELTAICSVAAEIFNLAKFK